METEVRCLTCSERFPAHVVAQFGGSCPACVAGFAEVAEEGTLKAGSSFGRYLVGEPIGRGGMGVVYRARQQGLDRDVALKILSPRFAADAEFVRRFEREAKTLASLNHPNIVTVHDTGVEAGTPYLAMELVEGVSLRRLLAERRLPPEEALGIVPQLCDALEYAHGRGVVHRDVKPENILIDTQGRVKVADFGLAVMVGIGTSRLTQTQAVLGTPHYMAPEQVENPRRVDHRADIYSMGVVFYEMLTGELPLGHFSMPSAKAKVHRRLDEIVVRALAKEPERRYQHASEFKSDVAAAPRQPGPPPPGDSLEWRSKTTIFGVPLIHVCMRRGGRRPRVAKGIIAIGDIAFGVVALGGLGFGGIAFGGAAIGLVAFGGFALAALAAIGGASIAGGAAVGGGAAAGYAAFGGGAYAKTYACGGDARARYVVSGTRSDEEAERFFSGWGVEEATRRLKQRLKERAGLRASYERGLEALQAGNYDAARELLEKVDASTSNYLEAQYTLGFDLYHKAWKRPKEGLPYLHRVLAAEPADPRAWSAVEEVSRAAGLPFERAIPQGDSYGEGMALYTAGSMAQAAALLIQVPRTHPEYAKAYRFVGYNIFVREWGRPLEGIPYLDKAFEAAPNDRKVLEDITRAYERAGVPFQLKRTDR